MEAASKQLVQHSTSLPIIINNNVSKAFNQRDINSTVIDDSSLITKKIKKKGSRLMSMPSREDSICEVSFCKKKIIG